MTKQLELDFEAKPSGPFPEPTEPDEIAFEEGTGGGSKPEPPDGNDPLRILMERNFLEYASYVICERAIPNLEDGLKPVQRRILHSLWEKDDGRFIKVANVVGHCMQYHPHGDASITDALTALTNKGFLIEGQGNFGNILTGDQAAAPRYIECRLTELARKEIFNKDLTRFVPSYDGRNQEPVTLPARLPLLLLLGAEGIAVGLSTRILPHNFRELLEAQIAILEKRPFSLLPDFPQGGLQDASEYNKGNGRCRLRARIEARGPDKLAVVELPYGTTTESLIASIEDAIRKKKVPVKAIDDFTAEKVNIELALAPEAKAEKAIRALFAFTACEATVSCSATVIHKGRPVTMDVEEILKENTSQLLRILKQELSLEKRRLLEEIHTKTLVEIFVENRIYKAIEDCTTYPEVQTAVLDGLQPFAGRLARPITKQDVEMLLGIRIRRISRFDLERNRKEVEALRADLRRAEKQLEDLRGTAVGYLKGLLRTYGASHPRHTQASVFDSLEIKELTARELEIRYDETRGYLGHGVKEGRLLIQCSSYDKILLVWEDGRYRVVRPPETLFVDTGLIYAAKIDRDRVMTIAYAEYGNAYLKKFRFGGTILNKEYQCAGKSSKILLFADDGPEEIYVKYKPAKRQRIHQQVFSVTDLAVKGVKARGLLMAPKEIDKIATQKPRWWKDGEQAPRGILFDPP
jgi:topoisomerase-4 subunit A